MSQLKYSEMWNSDLSERDMTEIKPRYGIRAARARALKKSSRKSECAWLTLSAQPTVGGPHSFLAAPRGHRPAPLAEEKKRGP